MTYRIFENTYRIPVKMRDKLELPSLCSICDYIAAHASDSHQCIFKTNNKTEAKIKWDDLKSLSLFIQAPFPYVLVTQYELDEMDLSKHVGFLTEKNVEPISNIDFLTCDEIDKIVKNIKISRNLRELAEKHKLEGINNARR